jgi:hypothetical protein
MTKLKKTKTSINEKDNRQPTICHTHCLNDVDAIHALGCAKHTLSASIIKKSRKNMKIPKYPNDLDNYIKY